LSKRRFDVKKFILSVLFIIISGVATAQVTPDTNKILSQSEMALQQEILKGKILPRAIPVKADYMNAVDRGTIKFDVTLHNYSYHKVMIPDGTIVKDCNFSQVNPHTVAVSGKDLTFENCNLNNVEIDASWRLIHSSNAQLKKVLVSQTEAADGNVIIVYSNQKELQDGKFEEIAQHSETVFSNSLSDALLKYHTK